MRLPAAHHPFAESDTAAFYPPRRKLITTTTTTSSLYRRTTSSQASQQAHSPSVNLAQKVGKSIRRPGVMFKAQVYAEVNVQRPKDYWDYEALIVQWG
jgi:hypothetical protein